MRAFVLTLLLASCSSSANDASLQGDDDGNGGVDPGSECTRDSDCQAAAAKCCDCPTYATSKTDSNIEACAGVMCPLPDPSATCPANVRPACSATGQCELACVAMACNESCADGFAVDPDGCLACACAQIDTRACTAASDCTRVPADCCGCANGGTDTAIPNGDVASYPAGLGCPSNPACPAGNSCPADLAPACVQGGCDLVPGLPGSACGRADLPACPGGQACTINADSAATAQGVGVCVTAT